MGTTAFDHPWQSTLFGDPEIATLFSTQTTLNHYLAFETALNDALADAGLIPPDAAKDISGKLANFTPDTARMGSGFGTDGVAVPEYIRQLKAHIGEPHAGHVHVGATSQDVIDTALVLMLRNANAILSNRMRALTEAFHDLRARFGRAPLMAYTRMQAALPITVADRLRTWSEPIGHHLDRLADLEPRLCRIQLGGPTGDRSGFGDKADHVARTRWPNASICKLHQRPGTARARPSPIMQAGCRW